MSMKMAKRVSKSGPWGLNRSPHEIEPLSSTGISLRANQTHWLGRLNAPKPTSDQRMRATHPLGSTSTADLQRSATPAPHLSGDRTHLKGNRTLQHTMGCADQPQHPHVRSFLESSPSTKTMTGHVRCTRSDAPLRQVSTMLTQPLTSLYVIIDRTHKRRVR